MTLPDPDDWPVERVFEGAVADFLGERAAGTPDRLGAVDADADERWTFGEFDDRVTRRAEQVAAFCEQAGSRVATLLDTGVTFAAVAFAVARVGGVLVPTNVDLDEAALADRLERADPDLVICDAATERDAVAATPEGVVVASVDESTGDGVESLDSRRDPAARRFESLLDDDRLVLFTSGTTGRPKGVRLTARNLVASASASAARLGVESDDRWLVCLPMYHMGGLAPLVRSTLYGTTTVIQREFDPADTARAIDEYDVTGVSLVPTMLSRLLDADWSPPEHLRFVLLGGGPAPESLIERALAQGVPAYPTYGTTETASQIATATPAEAGAHPGTVGRPLRDTEVAIVGDDGDPVEPGETGELAVDGPTVTPGYLDADATEAAFGEFGLETGDLGHADDGGRLWIVGRVDDAIVSGGETVHPARVVDALREIDGVSEAAVVGLPDEEWGERVTALVVPSGASERETGLVRAGESDASAHVRDAVRGRLPDYAVPKTVAFADELPRTPSGTVDRETVAERVREADE